MGLALLALRVGVLESGIFHRVKTDERITRGNFFALFSTRARALKYISIVLVGVPIWYAIGIPISFANDIGGAMGMNPVPAPATAVLSAYSGLAIGSFTSGLGSQWLKSRKKAIIFFCY